MQYNTAYASFIDWYNENDIKFKPMRVWYNSLGEDAEYELCYFSQIIPFGDEFIIGLQHCNDSYDDLRSPNIEYVKLSEITFYWFKSDEDPIEAQI